MSGNQLNASNDIQLDTIESAIEAIKLGQLIIVVDDEDRENEGDFITAARNVTPEIINFMATHGRGLICAPLIEDRCVELGLDLMVGNNTSVHATPFTVSIDLTGHNCSTGISASDRAKTIQALVDPNIRPEEFGKPGHIRREFVAKVVVNNQKSEKVEKEFFLNSQNYLNLSNGILNVKNGTLIPHSPDWGFKYCLPYDYDPTATAPRFEQ